MFDSLDFIAKTPRFVIHRSFPSGGAVDEATFFLHKNFNSTFYLLLYFIYN